MNKKDNNIDSLDFNDLELSNKLKNLEWDLQPNRDLWPDISSRIRFADKTRKSTPVWMPFAMAASLVLATIALVFSSMTYQRSLDTDRYQATLAKYQESQLALIEQQHQMVRVQFSQLLKNERDTLSPEFVSELETLLLNVDTASAEIKNALNLQPNNPDYTSMLVRTYQQEIKFLNTIQSSRANSEKSDLVNGISI
jgi:hypothetical protein